MTPQIVVMVSSSFSNVEILNIIYSAVQQVFPRYYANFNCIAVCQHQTIVATNHGLMIRPPPVYVINAIKIDLSFPVNYFF